MAGESHELSLSALEEEKRQKKSRIPHACFSRGFPTLNTRSVKTRPLSNGSTLAVISKTG